MTRQTTRFGLLKWALAPTPPAQETDTPQASQPKYCWISFQSSSANDMVRSHFQILNVGNQGRRRHPISRRCSRMHGSIAATPTTSSGSSNTPYSFRTKMPCRRSSGRTGFRSTRSRSAWSDHPAPGSRTYQSCSRQFHRSSDVLGLVLALHISFALSVRKTAQVLRQVFGVPLSYQSVLNYTPSRRLLLPLFQSAPQKAL